MNALVKVLLAEYGEKSEIINVVYERIFDFKICYPYLILLSS